MPVAYRSKQRIITLEVKHPVTQTRRRYTVRTKSGGGLSGNAEHAFLGGMTPQVSLGGDPEREDITLGIAYTDQVRAEYAWLDALCGRGEVTIIDQLNGTGSSFTYTGILDSVTPPEYDAADNTLQELEVVVSCDAPLA